MRRTKIFGIGLSRTGTTSLTEALQILGFSAIHYPISIQEIEQYDAATDLFVAATFEQLDAQFPASRFIYTVRERQSWLTSCQQHWARQGTQDEQTNDIDWNLRSQLYGTTDFDPALFAQAYERHEERVLRYFADRPRDLLVLDVCDGHGGWESLCSFLGVLRPQTPFPYTNRADPLDEVLIRLLHVIGDAEQVAQIVRRVSAIYIEGLRQREAFRTHDRDAPLHCEGNHKIDRALDRACAYFGSSEAVAAQLNVPKADIEAAIARRRRRKRAKRLQALQQKFRWLMRRTLGQSTRLS